MSRKCTVCTHPNFLEINQKLASPGVVYSELARAFNLGRKAVERHSRHYFERLKTSGIGDIYARAEIEKLFARVDSLQSEVDELRLQLETAQIVQTSSMEETKPMPSEIVSSPDPQNEAMVRLLEYLRKKKLEESATASP